MSKRVSPIPLITRIGSGALLSKCSQIVIVPLLSGPLNKSVSFRACKVWRIKSCDQSLSSRCSSWGPRFSKRWDQSSSTVSKLPARCFLSSPPPILQRSTRVPCPTSKMPGHMFARTNAIALSKSQFSATIGRWSGPWSRPKRHLTNLFWRRHTRRSESSVWPCSSRRRSDRMWRTMSECFERASLGLARNSRPSSSNFASPKQKNTWSLRSRRYGRSFMTTFSSRWIWSKKRLTSSSSALSPMVLSMPDLCSALLKSVPSSSARQPLTWQSRVEKNLTSTKGSCRRELSTWRSERLKTKKSSSSKRFIKKHGSQRWKASAMRLTKMKKWAKNA